ncbi:hypothetical protein J6590_026487 [Homalodisca vitripennis]|nr:hypothetical protein J6590_026487 [Homalodisca vitripennis]
MLILSVQTCRLCIAQLWQEEGNSQPKPTYPDGLQELCNDLHNHCTLMSKVVERMLTTKTEVGGVVKLETLRNSSDSPMFLTWPADRFELASKAG